MATNYTPLSVGSAATSTNLNSPLQELDNAIENKALRVFNVKGPSYGAKGDGTTDDRVAIQAALDACNAAGGGIVYFPPGTYLVSHAAKTNGVTAGLMVYSNQHLMGAGKANTVIKTKASQASASDMVVNQTVSTATDHDITISDMTLDGNCANQAVSYQVGISINKCRSVVIQNVVVKNIRGTTTAGVGESFNIDFNTSTDCYAINCECFVDDSGSSSSGFSGNSSNNLHFIGCTAHNMTVCNGFTVNGCRQVEFVACQSYLNAYFEFNCENSESVTYSACVAGGRGANIANNWIAANASMGSSGGVGFAIGFCISTSSQNVRVSDCVARNEDIGVYISNNCSYVKVSGDYSASTNPVSIAATEPLTVDIDLGAGNAFPSNPCKYGRFYRTDLGWPCYYDGTRWLTVEEFPVTVPNLTGSFTIGRVVGGIGIYVQRIHASTNVAATNDGTKYWTITFRSLNATFGAATNVHAFNTSADTAGAWTQHDANTMSATAVPANYGAFDVLCAQTSTPGALSMYCIIYYRLIVT